MSSLSRDEVAHVAMLARINLTDDELDTLAGQLDQIVGFVAAVGEIGVEDVPPMSHPLPLSNVTRPDVVRPSLDAAEALAGAPKAQAQRFAVPRILDEE
ncbi:Asp-tRNA(Asn)/Glu-tRNA(Gln) amidotransferase subunit GatC [Leekyejoonella antrihumi]|uniref:Aspartyl/glutamyl-tRNA(Asn/Gln) amidotransferase subunit C n=1 Tax=Leekyejoonella antrihumi TaxID=1660198 RepID=A0A563DSS5_9MICO|nr:Asp-tRNA(Asn)/Glu-tRNA(Gln) amidotransferase subunit GatC [Leekyejoonella antrihumi]TWP33300.1 Asp-tRNA(Asn)/Glu-tRNA(Gln) amidotransferase subunit GatC [Leekyejoonella antrihumi]